MEIKQEIAQVQKRPETFEDIRKDAEAKFRELVEAWMQRRTTFQTTVGAMQSFNNVFDRIEAALRREKAAIEADALAVGGYVAATAEKSSAVGDCAKLREALGKLRAELWNNTVIAGKRKFELYEIADAALAAPPRNCDLAQDWLRDLYVNFKPPASVKREMPPEWVDAVMAFCRWLLATATTKEGGAK